MFDIGWSELLLVAVLAIIFVGPKDLPKVMRTAGRYAGRMRAMAREFQNSFEDLAKESELDELRREVASLRDQTAASLSDVTTPRPEIHDGGEGAEAASAGDSGASMALPAGEQTAEAQSEKQEAGQG